MRFGWSWVVIVLGLSAFGGCAEGGVGTAPDAGGRRDASGGGDAGGDDAGARDGGRRDGGSTTTCDPGQHACGGGCIDDLANDPANGCSQGCGEPCPAPPSGELSCTSDGRCSFECTPPYRPLDGTCVCEPFTCDDMGWACGAPDNGCGMPLNCGSCGSGTCIDGTCACGPDSHETDDSSTTAPSYGTLDDADDPADVVLSDHTIDEMRDVDWMRFAITDGSDGGNPRATVSLANVPVGDRYELSAFFVCGSGTDDTSCAMGTADNELGNGCSATTTTTTTVELETNCSHLGTNDSGTLYVRVQATEWGGECSPYRVTVRVR